MAGKQKLISIFESREIMMYQKEDNTLKVNDLNATTEKKAWIMPDLILIDKNVIESGVSVVGYETTFGRVS